MDCMRRFAVLAAFCAIAAAGKAPKKYIDWASSWTDAIEEAQTCNLPIVVRRHGFY